MKGDDIQSLSRIYTAIENTVHAAHQSTGSDELDTVLSNLDDAQYHVGKIESSLEETSDEISKLSCEITFYREMLGQVLSDKGLIVLEMRDSTDLREWFARQTFFSSIKSTLVRDQIWAIIPAEHEMTLKLRWHECITG